MVKNLSYVVSAIHSKVASTRPPAKLNLFLELLSRRDDGYHDLETVMIPIDWRDELRVRRTAQAGITLKLRWAPSSQVLADRLGIGDEAANPDSMLRIPSTESNLVYKAIAQFQQRFDISGGFDCDLRKQIPAGAGMGGASSDAASALQCAAKLCGVPSQSHDMYEIAASIGSDVPFFLGMGQPGRISENRGAGWNGAARATGRGERLEPLKLSACLHFVVVYPCQSLSTALVYAQCKVPKAPISSEALVLAMRRGDVHRIGKLMCNRLSEPAKNIVPVIDEILDSMWRSGLQACQLTGSGSACFGIAASATSARRCAARLQASLQPGALVKVARSTGVPTAVFME